PRIGVSPDGLWAMAGLYKINGFFDNMAQFPNAITAANVGGNAVDPKNNVIWAQISTLQPNAPQSLTDALAGVPPTQLAQVPSLMMLDPDNLYVKETFATPENITGRMLVSANSDFLYAVSDSGVMVFPIGGLNQQNRIT